MTNRMHGSQGAPAQQCAGATQLAEDRADGVRAGPGDRAQPRDGAVVPGLRRRSVAVIAVAVIAVGPIGGAGVGGRGGGG